MHVLEEQPLVTLCVHSLKQIILFNPVEYTVKKTLIFPKNADGGNLPQQLQKEIFLNVDSHSTVTISVSDKN